MKKSKLITAVIAVITLCMVLSVSTLAYEDMGGAFSSERVSFSLQMTGVGMLMIFAVLALLWGVISLSRFFCYDLPNRKKKAAADNNNAKSADVTENAEVTEETQYDDTDDGEICAAITAAIAMMLTGDEYKGQFENGFRVVSFRRAGGGTAWNKNN